MLKESTFFAFLNRRKVDFGQYLRAFTEDTDYIGWHQFVLPNDYGDAEEEYQAIRKTCALFDVSPIRKYEVRGAGAGSFLDYLLTRPVSSAPSMRGIYVAYCNENGSLKDDSILYKFADDDYLLMPSDMNHDAYFESLKTKQGIDDVSIVECTDKYAGVAIQGPLSATLLKHMGFDGIELLEPFQVRDYSLMDEAKDGATVGTMRIARMGFTADLGYECWFETELSTAFERQARSAGDTMGINLPGYGLTALEVCRLEGGFIVAGWDCATEADPNPGFERSPFELGIGWLVDLNAGDFVGRDALIEQKRSGFQFALRSFEMPGEELPDDSTVIWGDVDGKVVELGSINCSAWSWGLGKTIGNASIKREYIQRKQAWAMINNERREIELSRGPLLNLTRRNQIPAPLEVISPLPSPT